MTNDKATALREAAERATPGDWRVQGVGPAVLAITNYLAGTAEHVVAEDAIAFIDRADNATYIALADPPTIVALLAERERLRGALRAVLAVRVEGHENIWAGAERCRSIARQALEASHDQ